MLKTPDKSTKALLELAEFFDTLDPQKYDQRSFENPEGGRCICGWVNYRNGKECGDHNNACQVLGIDTMTGHSLFKGNGGMRTDKRFFYTTEIKPTPKDAARCLRHLAVTGEVPSSW